jgi:hypothetical protein
MSENDESKQFFDEEQSDKTTLFVEVPVDRPSPYQEKIPSALDPMGEIYLRGRASRTLSGGRIPWWVLITGWAIFGGIALLLIFIASYSGSLELFILLPLAAIYILILLRGTLAKLSGNRHKNTRNRNRRR